MRRSGLRWHVPPECQGQIVEVAYCQVDDGGILLRRTTDTSLSAGHPDRVAHHEIWLDDDEQDLAPWDTEPSPRGEWRSIDAARVKHFAD